VFFDNCLPRNNSDEELLDIDEVAILYMAKQQEIATREIKVA
jgi:hypothetical protein